MADTDLVVTTLTATTGGLGSITVNWTYGGATSPLPYLAIDHFEVWVATSNDRSLATKAADSVDFKYQVTGLGYSVSRWFWIRAIDVSGNVGDWFPTGSTSGVQGTTRAAIGVTDFASGIAAPQIVSSLASAVTGEGNLAILTTDGRLYRYHAGAWTAEVPTNVLSGQIITAQLATAAVTANELASAAVTNVKLAALAVATANVQLSAVDSTLVANAAIVTAGLASVAVTAAKVANATLTTTQIAATTIVAGNIASGTITTTQIAATTIVAGNIAATTITSTQMAASSITTTQLAAGAVTAAKITAGTITANEIAAATITGDRLVASTITASRLVLTDFSNLINDSIFQDTAAWNLGTSWAFQPLGSEGLPTDPFLRSNLSGSGFGAGGLVGQATPQAIPVEQGVTYAIGASHKTLSSATGNLSFRATWLDASGTLIGSIINLFGNTTAPYTAIVNSTGLFTAPSNAAKLTISARRGADGSGNVSGWIGISNWYVRRAASAELIVDGTITGGKIAANTIDASNIVANTLTAGTIAAGAIGTTQLAAGAVTATVLAANAVTAGKINAGAISTSSLMVDGVVITAKIATHGVNDLQQATGPGTIAYGGSTTGASTASLSLTFTDYPAQVGGYVDFTTPAGAGTQVYSAQTTIVVSGTEYGFGYVPAVSLAASTRSRLLVGGVCCPPNGTYTVRVRLWNSGANGFTYTLNDAHIGIANPMV